MCAKPHTPPFGRRQSNLGTVAYVLRLLLGDAGEDVYCEVVGVGIVATDKGDAGLSERGRKRHIASKPSDVRDDQRSPLCACSCNGFGDLYAVATLARFDLGEFGYHL